jgi:hypothetical protein
LFDWNAETSQLTVVENVWQKAVANFAAGAFITKKFNK